MNETRRMTPETHTHTPTRIQAPSTQHTIPGTPRTGTRTLLL